MDNGIIPDRFPVSEEETEERHSRGRFQLRDINWIGIGLLLVLMLLFLIIWFLIREISGVGSGLGSAIMGWFRRGSINPEDTIGFTYFLRLLLSAGFIGLFIAFLRRK